MKREIEQLMAELTAPYDPVKIVADLLKDAVYDRSRNDACFDAVQNALGYLEQEGSPENG